MTLSVGVMVLFRDRFRLVAPIYRNRPFTFVQRHFGDVHPKCAYGTCTSPRSGTKFAHALIKYRLSQMSLHRIHHPPQKAVHDARKAPLSPPRPKPIGALWLVLQFFPQPACFPAASGWGIFPVLQLFPQLACFPIASGWGIFPVLQLFPQPTCFTMASGWVISPISQLFPQSACFPIASGWGIFPVLQLFPQPACFLIASGWGIFPVLQLFPQPACFSIAKAPGYKPGVSKHILVIIAIQLFHFLFTRVCIVQLQNYLCILTAYAIHDLEQ